MSEAKASEGFFSADAGKTLHLVSQEGDLFDVPIEVAKMSKLVETMIDDDQEDDAAQEIPLPNVKTAILAKVVEFCKRHKAEAMTEIEKVRSCFDHVDWVPQRHRTFPPSSSSGYI